ncbi:MlaD family protein [Nocardia alba]|uniref:Phospholipid/cholesterol/gamma-HCH transport system substrate-binding protein n=1 Tax=Nocardia alba TaxID=225051 RepID=A0A4R1FAL5_9NOCA|nr:MlaD family protein [Nocardia alba]TCJ89759.1 phospholipid/cholesterol/gamma-HCH transport system substrate-binding protein [Nocardia alba]
MTTRFLLLRVATAVALMAVVLVGVLRVIERPIDGETDTYTALFTDANGLRGNDDVRLYGVQVGKVRSVELDGALARVTFIVSRDRPVFTNSVIAIRYQNLTGFRYLDIEQPEQPASRRDPATVFGTAETVPDFDITRLFKGLQPVLAELSPDDLNRFATSILAVVQGDGTGVGQALGAIDKLSRYASDRQAVLATLASNLAQVSDHLGGRSGNAMTLLTNLTNLFIAITEKLPGLVDFAIGIPGVLQPLRSMLTVFGFSGEPDGDLDLALRRAFPDPYDAVAAFENLPGLIQAMTQAVPPTGPDLTCAHGDATAPQPLRVLIDGQGIVLCHR